MTQLEDRRPVAATTTASDNPSVIGEDLAHLLVEHPDLELASIRLIPNDDGTVGIAGRIGELATVECPQCHQPIGRPHTEYCPLALREDVFAGEHPAEQQANGSRCPACFSAAPAVRSYVAGIPCDDPGNWHNFDAHVAGTAAANREAMRQLGQTSQPATRTSQPCTYPRDNHGDGRGCGHDGCPRHGEPEDR
jgi:hypothetical protein